MLLRYGWEQNKNTKKQFLKVRCSQSVATLLAETTHKQKHKSLKVRGSQSVATLLAETKPQTKQTQNRITNGKGQPKWCYAIGLNKTTNKNNLKGKRQPKCCYAIGGNKSKNKSLKVRGSQRVPTLLAETTRKQQFPTCKSHPQ